MDALIALYSKETSSRFIWAARVFFKDAMKCELRIYTNESEFKNAAGIKINYSPENIKGAFHISPQGLLWENELVEQDFQCAQWEDLVIFCTRTIGDLPFDPLSGTFYLASRYEEYLPFIADEHGRFPAEESFAFKNGFLDKPIINLWALKLGKQLFGDAFSLSDHYRFEPTLDIDNMFAYKGKGSLRIIGAYLRDIRNFDWFSWRYRTAVIFGFKKDPYDTFRKQRNWCKKYGVKLRYFMLLSKFAPYDRNVSPYSTDAAVKLRELADWTEVGIHPSYASDSDEETIREEKDRLETILRRPVVHSRQHYLKMKMPLTFRTLVNLGIKHDHSMGYAEIPGYRASIAVPYSFYDLEFESILPLTIHPFVYMDTTYSMYAGQTAEESKEEIMIWHEQLKEVGGFYRSVWHNRTFGEHERESNAWVQLFKQIVHAAHH